MFLHHVHHGMNLQEAIDCPAFHTEHMPSSFYYPRAAQPGLLALESRFPEATRAALARRGIVCASAKRGRKAALSGCAREETPEGRVLKVRRQPRGMQGYAVRPVTLFLHIPVECALHAGDCTNREERIIT